MRLIVLDTETTGLSPESGDKIVEIGAIEIVNGKARTDKTFQKLVDPERNIPKDVVRIHGIDTEALKRAKAKPFSEIGSEFLDFIKGGTLVIHNAAFDLGFIVNELALAGLADIDDMDVIDTLALARQKFPDQLNNLHALCDRFDISRNHRQTDGALIDVSLLANVYLEMMKNDSGMKHVRKVRDYHKPDRIRRSNDKNRSEGVEENHYSLSSLIIDLYKELEDRFAGSLADSIKTGFSSLDHLTNGLHQGDLIIVGGRPSMGKSSFAIDLVSNITYRSDENYKVALFSLKMSSNQWATRMLASEARIDTSKLHAGKFNPKEWKRIALASGLMAEAAIHIDDSNSISIQELCAKCRMLKESPDGLDIIVIDCLQLIRGREDVEYCEQECRETVRYLKKLAVELDVPIVALSQLNRSVDCRDDHRPRMSDLSGSQTIEEFADLILLIYQESFYNPGIVENETLAEIIIAKHLNGPTGIVKMKFIGSYRRFKSIR